MIYKIELNVNELQVKLNQITHFKNTHKNKRSKKKLILNKFDIIIKKFIKSKNLIFFYNLTSKNNNLKIFQILI